MYINDTPSLPLGKPCWRDMSQLTSSTGLLPANVVPLMPMRHLKRRIREINFTHPRFQEETPLVLAHEMKRRRELNGEMKVSVNQSQVA